MDKKQEDRTKQTGIVTKNDLETWFADGQDGEHTHMVTVLRHGHYYPVYIVAETEDEAKDLADEFNTSISQFIEVYSYAFGFKEQITSFPCTNWRIA